MRSGRRKPAVPAAGHDPDLAAARRHSADSGRRADRDLAYQQAKAEEEYTEIAVPLRRFRTDVNHIAELIAESLGPRKERPAR